MYENACVHINNFKSTKGLQLFKFIYAYFIQTTSSKARIFKAVSLFCHSCNTINTRLHSCLQCIYFGCYQGGHIQEHAKLKKHYLAVDLAYGMTMCFQCGDYVYDSDIICLAQDYGLKTCRPNILSKWHPDRRGIELLLRNPRRRKMIKNSSIGLRGLVNLGNTCYFNSIIQVFTHTPLLRDYFLSDKNHYCRFSNEPDKCLFCEFSRLFQEFYSGDRSPLMLQRLLHLIWTYEDYFIGPEQHDAHEFYIAALNLLHKHGTADPLNENMTCNCIIHQIFNGNFQSDVVCQACNGISTTYEAFWEIQLDLVQPVHNNHTNSSSVAPTQTSSSSSSSSSSLTSTSSLSSAPTSALAISGSVPIDTATTSPSVTTNSASDRVSNNAPTETAKNTSQISLIDCLERFTRTEHLGSNEKIECSNCQSYQESTKQFSMKKLPVVLCFHLKRFEHSLKLKQKISTYCSFPEHLDMTPFMSNSQNINNHHGPNGINGHPTAENRYSLFAMVKHSGSLNGGHYISYIRQQRNNWFKCSDDEIQKTSLEDVLNSEGYLLFYHKELLEYE